MGLTFIDWFAGVGGFRRGMEMAGHKCIGFCEFDKYAVASYTSMHLITEEQREYLSTLDMKKRQKEILKDEYRNGEWYASDVRTVRAEDIPRADCWCFGFPCQDISVAGKQLGFNGHRSSLFFAVTKLIRDTKEEDRPQYLFIENVKNLLSVNRGFDFAKLLVELDEVGYDAEWSVLNSKDHGVPQNRERVFIIGQKRNGNGGSAVFPVRGRVIHGEVEKVFLLSEGISRDKGLFQRIFCEGEGVPKSEVQNLLKRVQHELSTGESREVERFNEEVRCFCEGNLQEIEIQWEKTRSENFGEGFCGVVSIPTEEMLLLWSERRRSAQCKGCVQQQDEQTVCGSDGFIEGLRNGKYSSLLLAVQSHQGRFFYSIGDGRDWAEIYSKEVGECKTTLISILEDEVDEKYFLSKEQMEKIVFQ